MKTLLDVDACRKLKGRQVSYFGTNCDQTDSRCGDFVFGTGKLLEVVAGQPWQNLQISVRLEDGAEIQVDPVEVKPEYDYEYIEKKQIHQRIPSSSIKSYINVHILYDKKNKNLLVVFSEPSWNTGRSVTNSIEYLIADFFKEYGKFANEEINFYEQYEINPLTIEKVVSFNGYKNILWHRLKEEQARPIVEVIENAK